MNYPISIVDNFYNNPDAVRELALKQEFKQTTKGGFPGKRTKPIHEIDRNLFNFFNHKLLSLYYDIEADKDLRWKVNTCFDMAYPFGKFNNEGWIHRDDYESKLVGVLYLSKDCDTGTSFYDCNNNYIESDYDKDIRKQFYIDRKNKDLYLERQSLHNSNFTKSVQVKGKYNRLVVYDSNYWHGFDDISNIDERLIQVFHVVELSTEKTPLDRKYGNR